MNLTDPEHANALYIAIVAFIIGWIIGNLSRIRLALTLRRCLAHAEERGVPVGRVAVGGGGRQGRIAHFHVKDIAGVSLKQRLALAEASGATGRVDLVSTIPLRFQLLQRRVVLDLTSSSSAAAPRESDNPPSSSQAACVDNSCAGGGDRRLLMGFDVLVHSATSAKSICATALMLVDRQSLVQDLWSSLQWDARTAATDDSSNHGGGPLVAETSSVVGAENSGTHEPHSTLTPWTPAALGRALGFGGGSGGMRRLDTHSATQTPTTSRRPSNVNLEHRRPPSLHLPSVVVSGPRDALSFQHHGHRHVRSTSSQGGHEQLLQECLRGASSVTTPMYRRREPTAFTFPSPPLAAALANAGGSSSGVFRSASGNNPPSLPLSPSTHGASNGGPPSVTFAEATAALGASSTSASGTLDTTQDNESPTTRPRRDRGRAHFRSWSGDTGSATHVPSGNLSQAVGIQNGQLSLADAAGMVAESEILRSANGATYFRNERVYSIDLTHTDSGSTPPQTPHGAAPLIIDASDLSPQASLEFPPPPGEGVPSLAGAHASTSTSTNYTNGAAGGTAASGSPLSAAGFHHRRLASTLSGAQSAALRAASAAPLGYRTVSFVQPLCEMQVQQMEYLVDADVCDDTIPLVVIVEETAPVVAAKRLALVYTSAPAKGSPTHAAQAPPAAGAPFHPTPPTAAVPAATALDLRLEYVRVGADLYQLTPVFDAGGGDVAAAANAGIPLRLPRPQHRHGTSAAIAGGGSTGSANSADAGSAREPEVDDATACVVCFSAPRNVITLPCAHFAMCAACCRRVRECPMCREPINIDVGLLYTEEDGPGGAGGGRGGSEDRPEGADWFAPTLDIDRAVFSFFNALREGVGGLLVTRPVREGADGGMRAQGRGGAGDVELGEAFGPPQHLSVSSPTEGKRPPLSPNNSTSSHDQGYGTRRTAGPPRSRSGDMAADTRTLPPPLQFVPAHSVREYDPPASWAHSGSIDDAPPSPAPAALPTSIIGQAPPPPPTSQQSGRPTFNFSPIGDPAGQGAVAQHRDPVAMPSLSAPSTVSLSERQRQGPTNNMAQIAPSPALLEGSGGGMRSFIHPSTSGGSQRGHGGNDAASSSSGGDNDGDEYMARHRNSSDLVLSSLSVSVERPAFGAGGESFSRLSSSVNGELAQLRRGDAATTSPEGNAGLEPFTAGTMPSLFGAPLRPMTSARVGGAGPVPAAVSASSRSCVLTPEERPTTAVPSASPN